jgi:hypothetical protein
MNLTKRQKELLEEILWEQYNELSSLINQDSMCVDNRKVVLNILYKLQEEK